MDPNSLAVYLTYKLHELLPGYYFSAEDVELILKEYEFGNRLTPEQSEGW